MAKYHRGKRREMGTSEGVHRVAAGRTNLSASAYPVRPGRSSQHEYDPSTASVDAAKQRRRKLMIVGVVGLVALGIIIGTIVGVKGKNKSSSENVGSQDESPITTPAAPTVPATGETPAYDPKDYTLVKAEILKEYQIKMLHYKHVTTGMEILGLVPLLDTTADATFGLNFRTPPLNNRGTPDVVTQTVQLGSINFPVKDPLNQVQHGSLASHVEWKTLRDRTHFVLSSPHPQDFSNSIEVLLDAVWEPRMVTESWTFRQEAWRLDQAINNQGQAHIWLNGNAFNQAKVDQMHPQKYMMNYLYPHLFPDTQLGFNIQGEQEDVLQMSHSEVVAYWKNHYHPANAQAVCFGSQAVVESCLGMLDVYLKPYPADPQAYQAIRESTAIKTQALSEIYTERQRIPYASFQETVDYRIVKAWVLNDAYMDYVTQVAWMVIKDMLIGSQEAVFFKLIHNLKLGDDTFGDLEMDYRQWIFYMGVSGISREQDVDVAQNAIVDILIDVTQNGFPDEMVVASLNKVEYQIKAKFQKDVPIGVDVFKKVTQHWNYNKDPTASLGYLNAFDQLLEDYNKNGQGFLLDLITKWLVDNGHSMILELYPSLDLAGTYRQQEVNWLNNLKASLTHDEGVALVEESAALLSLQERPDTQVNLAKLPRLGITQLPAKGYEIPTRTDSNAFDSGVTLFEHELPNTNGVAYVDFAIDLSNVSFEDMALVPFYCQLTTEAGIEGESTFLFRRRIDRSTGGLEVLPFIEDIVPASPQGKGYFVPDGTHFETKLILRTSSFVSSAGSMFSVLVDVLFRSNLNNKSKAIDIVRKMIDDLEDDIQTNGHIYASRRIEGRYSLPGLIREKWFGISQLYELRRLKAQIDNQAWDGILQRLEGIQNACVQGHRNGMYASITADKDTLAGFATPLSEFFGQLLPPQPVNAVAVADFSNAQHPWTTQGLAELNNFDASLGKLEAFVAPTRINHVGVGGQIFEEGEKLSGADLVVSQFISGFYLSTKLEEMGAHSAWAGLDNDSGVLVFQSAQDPHLIKTLSLYDRAASYVGSVISGAGNALPVEAQAALVGAIGRVDAASRPQPSQVGLVHLSQVLKRDSFEHRQQVRKEMLETGVEDFDEMIGRLAGWGEARTAIVTNEWHYQDTVNKGLSMTRCSLDELGCTAD